MTTGLGTSITRGSEAALRQTVKKKLGLFGLLIRVENGVGPGTPDLAYCLWRPPRKGDSVSGWIELKFLPAFPRDQATPLVIESLTLEQVLWAEAWAGSGGKVCMVLQVASDYFLLEAPLIRRLFKKQVTEADLWRGATVSDEGFPTKRILAWLTGS